MKKSSYKLQDFIGGVVLDSTISDHLLERVISEKETILKTGCFCCKQPLATNALMELSSRSYDRERHNPEKAEDSFVLRPSYEMLNRFFQTFCLGSHYPSGFPGEFLINENLEKLPEIVSLWLKERFSGKFGGDVGNKYSREELEEMTNELQKYSKFLDEKKVILYKEKLELLQKLFQERERAKMESRRWQAVSEGDLALAQSIATKQGRSLTTEELGTIAKALDVVPKK